MWMVLDFIHYAGRSQVSRAFTPPNELSHAGGILIWGSLRTTEWVQ